MTDSSEMVKDADAQQDQCRYPIRVLHLTSLKKNNYFLNNLVDYCDRRAIEFTVVTLTGEGEFSAELRKRGILAYCLDCSQRRRAFHACCSLGQIIHRHDIDIVHTHLFEPTLIGMTVAKLLGKLTIMTRHHSDALYRIRNPFKRWVYLHLEQYSSALADHVIAPAAEVKRILVQCEKVRESKISLIPYPQDFRRFQSVSENDIAKVKRELDMGHTPDLVCVSRLHPEKGHIYLFEALAALRCCVR